MATTAVRSDTLHPGDVVQVSVATGIEVRGALEWDVRVADSGELNLPIIGPVPVGGLTTTEAAERITQEAIGRGKYVAPKITVVIEKPRTYQVRVVGAVNEPDTYELPAARSDLLMALTRARGLADDAAMTVEIRHPDSPELALGGGAEFAGGEMLAGDGTLGGEESLGGDVAQASFRRAAGRSRRVRVDLNEVGEMSAEELRLYDGSVVMVSRRSPRRVNVLGLVREPSAVEMPDGEDLYLLDAIAAAKGTTNGVANQVRITRRVEGEPEPVIIEATLRDARRGGPSNIRLAPGDVVTVEQTPLTVAVDTITTFFRVGFSAALPGL
ncbi:polysaccharide biosynthesis/export family protein [Candidatus Laterigemmans baculatus]|uniref:polysaccharide biosynthesis/export family protein n=1 Tax=Candidatus Laterigemmans baculatus TaxID=2770505 RepID=UPI0013DC5173|nr:polysaccharide biosynthesis/export family protein [Candidatus Laterigemmans baculatus]